jgi:hypothetical protein
MCGRLRDGERTREAAAWLKSAKGSLAGDREGAAREGVGGETESRANAAGFIGRMPSGSGLAGRYRSSANIGLVCIGGGDGDVVDGK